MNLTLASVCAMVWCVLRVAFGDSFVFNFKSVQFCFHFIRFEVETAHKFHTQSAALNARPYTIQIRRKLKQKLEIKK